MYIQKILFGSPGTGKSFKIKNQLMPNLLKITDSSNEISAVFHPEYTYGDFMGKLLPLTDDTKNVEYKYYQGHFLRALMQAYKNIWDKRSVKDAENVCLVIDEINRGNSASIFGPIFQLLDRDESGWSSYAIHISDMEFDKIGNSVWEREVSSIRKEMLRSEIGKIINAQMPEMNFLNHRQIKLPPNLSILATMNTSDNSIYYMDSAFKRRWEWEFIDIKEGRKIAETKLLYTGEKWVDFIDRLNNFIKNKYKFIRKIEDKQIGYWFIPKTNITKEDVQSKLMFFVWDSVFSNDKKPLRDILNVKEEELVTFGDFSQYCDKFIENILKS